MKHEKSTLAKAIEQFELSKSDVRESYYKLFESWVSHRDEAARLFRLSILEGEIEAFVYLAQCLQTGGSNDPRFWNLLSYLKAAVIQDNNADAWFHLAVIFFNLSRMVDAQCCLQWSWRYSGDNIELKNNINQQAKKLGYVVSFEEAELDSNELDRLWLILSPSRFWLQQCKNQLSARLANCDSAITKKRFDSLDSYSFQFEKAATEWVKRINEYQTPLPIL